MRRIILACLIAADLLLSSQPAWAECSRTLRYQTPGPAAAVLEAFCGGIGTVIIGSLSLLSVWSCAAAFQRGSADLCRQSAGLAVFAIALLGGRLVVEHYFFCREFEVQARLAELALQGSAFFAGCALIGLPCVVAGMYICRLSRQSIIEPSSTALREGVTSEAVLSAARQAVAILAIILALSAFERSSLLAAALCFLIGGLLCGSDRTKTGTPLRFGLPIVIAAMIGAVRLLVFSS